MQKEMKKSIRNDIDILRNLIESYKEKNKAKDKPKTIFDVEEEIEISINADIISSIENIVNELEFESIPRRAIIEEIGGRKHIIRDYEKHWREKDERFKKNVIELKLLQYIEKETDEKNIWNNLDY